MRRCTWCHAWRISARSIGACDRCGQMDCPAFEPFCRMAQARQNDSRFHPINVYGQSSSRNFASSHRKAYLRTARAALRRERIG